MGSSPFFLFGSTKRSGNMPWVSWCQWFCPHNVGRCPKPPQRKTFLHKLLVKHPGYLPGICGWDHRISASHYKSHWTCLSCSVGWGEPSNIETSGNLVLSISYRPGTCRFLGLNVVDELYFILHEHLFLQYRYHLASLHCLRGQKVCLHNYLLLGKS